MADIRGEVHITGTDLPQWASETTLEKLLEVVEKLSGTSKEQKQILDKSFREIQKTGKASSKTGKGVTGSNKDVKLMTAFTTGLKQVGDEALDTAAGFDKLGGPLKNFGKALKNSSTSMKIGLAAMGGVFAIFGKGAAIYKSSAESMLSLSDSGIIIDNSFLGLHRTLAMTGMSMEQFNEVSLKYSRVVGQQGWKAINDLTIKVKEAAGGFSQFGLTTADATEYQLEYLDQQRMVGVFRTMKEKDQINALKENMKQLTMYSKVLNVSRDDLQSATREMMSNADLQAELFSIVDPEERARAQEAFKKTGLVLASLGAEGQEALKLMTDMAASPNPYGSASYQRLVEAGQTAYANTLLEMGLANKKGIAVTLDQVRIAFAGSEEQIAGWDALRLSREGSVKDEAVARTNLARVTAESIVQAEANLQRFKNAGGDIGATKESEEFLAWLGKVNKDQQGVTEIVDSMNRITATFDRGVIELTTRMVEVFIGKKSIGEMATTAGQKLGAVADWANKWIDAFSESEDPMGMILSIVGKALAFGVEMIVAAITRGFEMIADSSITAKISNWWNTDEMDEKDINKVTDPTALAAGDRRNRDIKYQNSFMGTPMTSVINYGLSEKAIQKAKEQGVSTKELAQLSPEAIALVERGILIQGSMEKYLKRISEATAGGVYSN